MLSNHRKQEKTSTKTTLVFAKNGWKGNAKTGVENRQESTPRVRNKKHGERAMQGLKTAIQLQQVAMYLRQPPNNCLHYEPQPRQNYP